MMELTDHLRITDTPDYYYLEVKVGEGWEAIGRFREARELLRASRLHYVSRLIAPIREEAIVHFVEMYQGGIAALPDKKEPPTKGGSKGSQMA